MYKLRLRRAIRVARRQRASSTGSFFIMFWNVLVSLEESHWQGFVRPMPKHGPLLVGRVNVSGPMCVVLFLFFSANLFSNFSIYLVSCRERSLQGSTQCGF